MTIAPIRQEIDRLFKDEQFISIVDQLVHEHDPCVVATCEDEHKACTCQPMCSTYRRCCSIEAASTEHTVAELRWNLSKCHDVGLREEQHMVSDCPPYWTDDVSRRLCRNVTDDNILTTIPVDGVASELTYRNVYCAECNSVADAAPWEIYLDNCIQVSNMLYSTNFSNDINIMLDPKSLCRMSIHPREQTKLYQCSDMFSTAYQCSSSNVNDMTVTPQWTFNKSPPINVSRLRMAMTSFNLGPLSDPIHMVFRHICETIYSPVRSPTMRSIIDQNAFCSWCINESAVCYNKPNNGGDRLFNVRALVNFNFLRQLDIWGRAAKGCMDGELFSKGLEACLKMICQVGTVMVDGECREPFEWVNKIDILVTVYAPCGKTKREIQLFLNGQNIYTGKLNITLEYLTLEVSSGQKVLNTTERDIRPYCSKFCQRFKLLESISWTELLVVRQWMLTNAIYVEANWTSRVDEDTITNVSCEDVVDELQTDPNGCSEVAISAEQMNHLTDGAGFDNLDQSKTREESTDTIRVCFDFFKQIENAFLHKRSHLHAYEPPYISQLMTVCFLSSSILSLLVSVVIYSSSPDVRNLPGRICLQTMVCLLFAYIVMLVSNFVEHLATVCYGLAILSHFLWLCTFFSMFSNGIQLLKDFSQTAPYGRTNSTSGHLRHFSLAYCLSIFIVGVSCTLDNLGILHVNYGEPTCFINSPLSLAIVFAVPVGGVLLFNTVSTLYVILLVDCSAARSQRISKAKRIFENAVIAIKLSCVLGLAWIVGFLATFFDIEVLWFLHVILNSSQGITMLLAMVVGSSNIRRWMGEQLFGRRKRAIHRNAHPNLHRVAIGVLTGTTQTGSSCQSSLPRPYNDVVE